MFNLRFLDKENDLNKLLKNTKKNRNHISILFIELWDDYCSSLVTKLKEKYTKKQGEPLYIVDSFQMPHSFVIFSTTKVPHLVQMRSDNFLSEDYLPMIMDTLKIK